NYFPIRKIPYNYAITITTLPPYRVPSAVPSVKRKPADPMHLCYRQIIKILAWGRCLGGFPLKPPLGRWERNCLLFLK
ncbi:hypothetical protein, partial [Crocosphaera chwakensis]|uniref:hypothetical protein n=1 Tax=Crocosphaera chwakensis TaxID=2546361 RepID=UPI001E658F94